MKYLVLGLVWTFALLSFARMVDLYPGFSLVAGTVIAAVIALAALARRRPSRMASTAVPTASDVSSTAVRGEPQSA